VGFLAARDRRVSRVATHVPWGIDSYKGMCALHDPAHGIALIQMDGSLHVAGGPELLEQARRLLHEWETLGRPRARSWRCTFAETSRVSAPILTPTHWSLLDDGAERSS